MSARAKVANMRVENGECRDRAKMHRELARDVGAPPLVAAAHIEWAEAYELRAGKDPRDAEPGDPCGLVLPDGDICDGSLDCYVDAVGPVPNCSCHMGSPPCGACVEAPLACSTCYETVP